MSVMHMRLCLCSVCSLALARAFSFVYHSSRYHGLKSCHPQFTPPGGRVLGARYACSDALRVRVAQASQAACSAAFAGHLSEVIIEEGMKLSECSDGDDLDGWLSEIMGQTCRELITRGDGFCGIHATFGHCDPFRHELRHERPNDVLRSCFAHPLVDTRRSV